MDRDIQTLEQLCEPVSTDSAMLNHDALYRYADISSIDVLGKDLSRTREVAGHDLPSHATRTAKVNDVLVSLVRPDRNAVAIVPSELDGLRIVNDICVLRPITAQIEPRYLYYFVQSSGFVEWLVIQVGSTLIPRVRARAVMNAPIAVPPLAEQRRMVQLLDGSRALQLLHRNGEERLRRLLPAMLIDSRDTWAAASQYHVERLTTFATILLGESASASSMTPGQDTVPQVRPNDLESLFISDTRRSVDRSTELTVAPPGTILIATSTAAPTGYPQIAQATTEVAIGKGIAAVIVQSDRVESLYLLAWLLANPHALVACMENTGSRYRLNNEKLANLTIPIPPLSIMRALANTIQRLLTITQYTAARGAKLYRLFTTLVDRTYASSPGESHARDGNHG